MGTTVSAQNAKELRLHVAVFPRDSKSKHSKASAPGAWVLAHLSRAAGGLHQPGPQLLLPVAKDALRTQDERRPALPRREEACQEAHDLAPPRIDGRMSRVGAFARFELRDFGQRSSAGCEACCHEESCPALPCHTMESSEARVTSRISPGSMPGTPVADWPLECRRSSWDVWSPSRLAALLGKLSIFYFFRATPAARHGTAV